MIAPPKVEGFQFIPIDKQKKPKVSNWQKTRTDYNFNFADGVGLVCGAISGNLEVVDIDLKYDLSGTLYKRFKAALHEADPTLLGLMTVQRTRSGGYHFIYRCAVREGNRKLASRYTLPEEMSDPKDKVRVLLETRGDGGYIAVVPTQGYEMVYGSLDNIHEITPQQREVLMSVARSFNEVVVEYKAPVAPKENLKGLTPMDDYNRRHDLCIQLLERHGWSVVGQKGQKVLLKRGGNTTAAFSGNYDLDRGWLTVFSTSTIFEPETAYLPSAVYALLEHEGDFNAAASALYQQGFGDRIEKKKEEVKKPADIVIADNLDFLATPEDYQRYHKSLRDGTFQEYGGFGIQSLDRYLRLKDGDLYIINGIDNVGKSTVIWYLMLLGSLYYDWKWVVFTAENSVGGFMRKMVEFLTATPLAQLSERDYQQALQYIEDHFSVILAQDELYSLRQIMRMTDRVCEKKGHHKGLLADPYNALKLDLKQGAKNSTHEEHYEVVTELKLWGRNHDVACFLNTHVITEAGRRVDDAGYILAPNKADTEGGNKFANKADQFITIHRKTQHPQEWMYSELHIRKVKETETGGRLTPFDKPVRLRMSLDGCSFLEEELVHDTIQGLIPSGRTRNPILNHHNLKTNGVELLFEYPVL